MRPLIGVTPLWRTEKEHLWMRLEYLEGVMDAGGALGVFPDGFFVVGLGGKGGAEKQGGGRRGESGNDHKR